MPRLPNFVAGSYKSPSVVAAADQTINWIPAKIESGTGAGGVRYVFDPSPGFSLATALSSSGCRAGIALNEVAYFVFDDKLYEISGTPVSVVKSVLATIGGGGRASIATNGDAGHQVMATNGSGDLYYYDTISTGSGHVTTVNGNTVVFLNGFFWLLDETTSTLYRSAPLDGTTWNALNKIQRDDLADRWRTMIVKQNELWIFGSESGSVYFPDSNDDFGLVPNLNVTITRGINAAATLCLLQGSPIWLADDQTVRYAKGYEPVRISDHALEYAMSRYNSTTDADAFVRWEQGHVFYVLNFPSAGFSVGESWVYDVMTGMWHRVGPYHSADDTFRLLDVAYGVQIHATGGGATWPTLAGSRTGTGVYLMSQAYDTEIDGSTKITRRRSAPNLEQEMTRVVYDEFRLFVDSTAATMNLQWSDDGGLTYSDPITMDVGDDNYYLSQMLGQARNRGFRVTTASATRLIDAFVQTRPGRS